MKPILGCELYVAPGSRFERSSQDGGYEGASHCTVLGAHPRRLRQPHEARLQGLPRGLLLQATGGPRAAGPARGRAPRALGLPQLRGEPAAHGGDEAKALQTAGWYQEVFGKDYYFMEVQVARPRAAGGGDRGHRQDRPRHRRAPVRHERLALPRGRALARPRGAPLHPDRHHHERSQPVEVLEQRVLREVGRRDEGRSSRTCPRPTATRWRWPSGATSICSSASSTCPSTRCRTASRSTRIWRSSPSRASSRATADHRPTRWWSASATSWAWSPRWASPATSWWSGTSSATRAARGSRWGRGAAPPRARWSPTASASPTSTRSATG